jgi:hypothetical protein
MAKVFITNRGYHDYSDAERFGDIIFMSNNPSGMNQLQTGSMVRVFKPYIDTSSPEDYLVVGSFTVMMLVAASLFAKKHGRLNLLIYNSQRNKYDVRRVMLNLKEEETENG